MPASNYAHSTGACKIFGLVHRFSKVDLGLESLTLEVTCCACGLVRVKTPRGWVYVYPDGVVKEKTRKVRP